MNKTGIRNLIDSGEGISIEFKECRNSLNKGVFKCIVPLTPEATPEDAVQVTMQVKREKQICEFCQVPRSGKEIQVHIKIKDNEYFRKFILRPLLKENVLKPTIPNKPTSPNQKYYTTKEKK